MIVPRPLRMLACVLVISAAVGSPSVLATDAQVQQAVDRVQREHNGKVLSVQKLQIGKRKIYRIKVLTPDGQVKVVEVKPND